LTHQLSLVYSRPCPPPTLDLPRAARLFHALSDETRLAVLEMLGDGERCVCDLQDALDAAQSRLSFHLKVLKEAGLVTDRKEGRWSYYTLVPRRARRGARHRARARDRARRGPAARALKVSGAAATDGRPRADGSRACGSTHQHFLVDRRRACRRRTRRGDRAPRGDAASRVVREKYGEAARRVLDAGTAASCGGPGDSCCGGAAFNGAPTRSRRTCT
jgi:ArsR family transcriptional regulator